MESLSSYVLTKNSERYLGTILEKLGEFSDQILVIDSGSTDRTKEIALQHHKVEWVFNKFSSFKEQRIFAEAMSRNDYVFFLDSDEIPDGEFVENIKLVKGKGFQYDSYRIRRDWFVLGKRVKSIYPVTSPDRPIRLYNRKRVSFRDSNLVHETISGGGDSGVLGGTVHHYTFESRSEFEEKLDRYSTLAALDLLERKRPTTLLHLAANPVFAFLKWYIFKEAYRDGKVGLRTGIYAFRYTYLKYVKARAMV